MKGYSHNSFLISLQHMFSQKNEKNISSFRIEKVPYLELYISMKSILYFNLPDIYFHGISVKKYNLLKR